MSKERKGPNESATSYENGYVKKGNDGNKWIIKTTSNGVKRWIKFDDDNNNKNIKIIGGKKMSKKISKKISKKNSKKMSKKISKKNSKKMSKKISKKTSTKNNKINEKELNNRINNEIRMYYSFMTKDEVNLAKKLTKKIAGSKKAKIILEPQLLYGIFGGDPKTTGNKKLDKLIFERMKKDYTDVKSVFAYTNYSETIGFKFNDKKKVFEVTIKYDKADELLVASLFDTISSGPDTWMEGDIDIIKGEDIVDLGLGTWEQINNEEIEGHIELGLKIIDLIPIA